MHAGLMAIGLSVAWLGQTPAEPAATAPSASSEPALAAARAPTLTDAQRLAQGWAELAQLATTAEMQAKADAAAAAFERLLADTDAIWQRSAALDERLEAAQLRMCAAYLLASTARQRGLMRDMANWLGQIRAQAWRVTQLKHPAAGAVGEYWLMQTELMEINRLAQDRQQNQLQLTDRLEQYVQRQVRYGEHLPPRAQRTVLGTRITLMQLYDELGRTRQLRQLLEQVAQAPGVEADTVAQLRRRYHYVNLLDQPVTLELGLLDGRTWNSVTDLGATLTVLYFWPGYDFLESHYPHLHELLRHERVKVVMIDSSGSADPALQQMASPWARHRPRPGDASLLERFEVRQLPRFVVLNADGRVAALGGPGIGAELAEMLAQPVAAPASTP